jgi:hypothetical protein
MRTTRPFDSQKLLQHLSFENLGGEELDLEGEGGRRGGGGAGRGEDGSRHLPSSVGLLELHKPLIGCHAVARLDVVVQHVHRLRHLHLQLHLLSAWPLG